MTQAEIKLKELGFELIRFEESAGCWIYENVGEDQRVEISYDSEDWFIYSESISLEKDFFAMPYRIPMGLTYEEVKAFLDRIDELKGEN